MTLDAVLHPPGSIALKVQKSTASLPARDLPPAAAPIAEPPPPESPLSPLEAAYQALREEEILRAKRTTPPGQVPPRFHTPIPAADAVLICACALAYHPQVDIEAALRHHDRPTGFRELAFFFDNGQAPSGALAFGPRDPQRAHLSGFAFVDEERAYLVFRGTDYPRDWLVNLQAWMVEDPPRHAGFHAAWRDVAGQVRAWLSREGVSGRPLCIAGHSLGGAKAVLAAFELARSGTAIGRIVTIGQPCVGGEVFNKAFRDPEGQATSLAQHLVAYTHGHDPVPWLTNPLMGYGHIAAPQQFAHPLAEASYRAYRRGHPLAAPPMVTSEADYGAEIDKFSSSWHMSAVVTLILSSAWLPGLAPQLGNLVASARRALRKHASIGYVSYLAPGALLGPTPQALPPPKPSLLPISTPSALVAAAMIGSLGAAVILGPREMWSRGVGLLEAYGQAAVGGVLLALAVPALAMSIWNRVAQRRSRYGQDGGGAGA